MKKFQHRVSFHITNQEDATELKQALLDLGYTWGSSFDNDWIKYSYLCNAYGASSDSSTLKIGQTAFSSAKRCSVHAVKNKELFLALAGQTTGDEFHVGDYVYVVESKPGSDYRKDKSSNVFKIAEVHDAGARWGTSDSIWLRPIIGDGTGVDSNKCRKATREEIESLFINKMKHTFKVGDKVRIAKNNANSYSNNKQGDIGVITSLNSRGTSVQVEVEGRKNYGNNENVEHLELVNDKKYVKCIHSATDKFTVDEQYEILEVEDRKYTTTVYIKLKCNEGDTIAVPYDGGLWKFKDVSKESIKTNINTDMKFKNAIAVTGSQSLLKAFAEELNLLGYILEESSPGGKGYIITYPSLCKYGFYSHDGMNTVYTIPTQWDKALKIASEKAVVETVLEKGKWYVYAPYGTDSIVNYSGNENDDNYGFWNGSWRTELSMDSYCYPANTWREATHTEIEVMLITEAIKRGFTGKGIKFNDVEEGTYTHTMLRDGSKSSYYSDSDELQNGMSLYKQGKWATLAPATPNIIINGYKAVFNDDSVSFGCQTIPLDAIKHIHALQVRHSVDFTEEKDNIAKIVKHYNSL